MEQTELEKKAEEYVKEQILKHNRDVVLRPKNAVTYIDELKQAYLDGLAEGKTKWHEIMCCSQDLPPRSKDNHLHSVIVSNEYGEPIYYDYNIDEWCDMEGDVVSEGYKYWCELPKFKG